MPKGRQARYRMNRAVGVMNKGDEFTADMDDPRVVSLVGAGYTDLVSELLNGTDEDDRVEATGVVTPPAGGDPDGGQVRGEPVDDEGRAPGDGEGLQQ